MLATTSTSSSGTTGFGTWLWKPARSEENAAARALAPTINSGPAILLYQ